MKFLTFLNAGCVEICKNMLESAKKVGISMDDFYIYCIDDISFNSLKNEYGNVILYKSQDITEYQDWTFNENSGFRKIVENKWKIIQEVYSEHKNLCFVDSDIVFVKDPRPLIEGKDKVLFQSDCYPEGNLLCSGFMVFNDTLACANLINDCAEFDGEDDQLIVNRIAIGKYNNDYQVLSEALFPNGNVYYKQGRKEDAYIVHNNWMLGIEEKISKFKQENMWYV